MIHRRRCPGVGHVQVTRVLRGCSDRRTDGGGHPALHDPRRPTVGEGLTRVCTTTGCVGGGAERWSPGFQRPEAVEQSCGLDPSCPGPFWGSVRPPPPPQRDALEGWRYPPPAPSTELILCPATVSLTVGARLNGICNR